MENVDQNQTSDKTVLFTFQFASCKSNTDNRVHLLVLKYICRESNTVIQSYVSKNDFTTLLLVNDTIAHLINYVILRLNNFLDRLDNTVNSDVCRIQFHYFLTELVSPRFCDHRFDDMSCILYQVHIKRLYLQS